MLYFSAIEEAREIFGIDFDDFMAEEDEDVDAELEEEEADDFIEEEGGVRAAARRRRKRRPKKTLLDVSEWSKILNLYFGNVSCVHWDTVDRERIRAEKFFCNSGLVEWKTLFAMHVKTLSIFTIWPLIFRKWSRQRSHGAF